MRKKEKVIIGSLLVLFIVLFVLVFGRAIPNQIKITNENKYEINYLSISNDIFYRQTLNNCAPYSVMAVINILKGDRIDPEFLSKQIKWRIYKNLTFPQGIIDLLHKYKIKTKENILFLYSDKEKIIWLKNCINNNTPIILLVEIKHIKHYFTVIGYDEKGFMLYDSLQEKNKDNPRKTIIDNTNYAGNRYYSYDYIVKLWNDGGYKLFFRNWAITCSL